MREKLRTCWEQSALKAWAEGKLCLSRGKKLALNLVIILLAGGWLWGLAGYPLPTLEMEFRRLERQYLLPPSEMVFAAKDAAEWNALDGTGLRWTGAAAVGVRDDVAVVASSDRLDGGLNTIKAFALEDGPVLVPVAASQVIWVEVVEMSSSPRIDGVLLLLQMPREAASGELELEVTYREQTYHRDCPLFRLENGVWIAAVEPPEGAYFTDWYEGARYTLRLWGEDGALLLEKTGTVPEAI